ncbi:MAG: hypothetical protein H7Z14_06480 [Anaerolineae bacterium]|nr:hypothetical protein [Phycisphaerae bacterium]
MNSQTTATVFAGAGPGTVFASATNARLAQVNGEAGGDSISLSFSDRAVFNGPDGGPGDDIINVSGSIISNTVRPTASSTLNTVAPTRLISGGDGNDSINVTLDGAGPKSLGYHVIAGPGDDLVYGSAASDQLYGEDGNDKMLAGAGDDYVDGGVGDDYINGEAGDDFLDHGGGHDVVDGDDGHDIAVVDKTDQFLNIEELI